MAQIQRKKRFEDTLELLDENGNVCVTLPVRLDIEKAFVRLNKARRGLAKAQKEASDSATEEKYEALGAAIFELFASVFGDDGASDIMQHYENSYSEMMADIMPYLFDNVFPKLDELSAARVQQVENLRAAADNYARKHRKGKLNRRR